MVTFDVYVSTECVLVETLKSKNNRQYLVLYLHVPVSVSVRAQLVNSVGLPF